MLILDCTYFVIASLCPSPSLLTFFLKSLAVSSDMMPFSSKYFSVQFLRRRTFSSRHTVQWSSQEMNTDIMLFLSHRTYGGFANVLFSCSMIHSRITHRIAFSYLFTSFNLIQFLRLSEFHDLDTFGMYGPVAFRMFLNLRLSGAKFLHDYSQILHFWQEYHTSNIVSFLVPYIRRHMDMSVLFLVTLVNFDHLVDVVSTAFLHCRITIFHFAIDKCLIGRHI